MKSMSRLYVDDYGYLCEQCVGGVLRIKGFNGFEYKEKIYFTPQYAVEP